MPQLAPDEIKKRSDDAWRIRDLWRNILEDAYELVFAGINPYTQDKKNPRSMNRQFDSTATGAAIRLASRIVNELTPAYDDWVEISPGPLLELQYDKEQISSISGLLSGASKLANMIVNEGSAVAARHAAVLDCVISGMGVILGLEDIQDDQKPVSDQAVSQSEVAIDVNAKGEVAFISRKRKIKVREIINVWDDATVPEWLLSGNKKDKDPEIEVLEVTYEGGPKSNVKWYYEVIVCHSDKIERIVERNYDVNPWTILRWMVIPGMPYGPGPVLLGLADIRTANKVMEFILQNAALALAGMYLVRDDGVVNIDNLSIVPGALIPVQSTGGGNLGASIAPLSTNREFDVGNIVLEQLRTAIKKHLFDGSLPAETGSPRSATEWIQRIKDLNQDLGVGIGMMMADIVEYVRRRLEILVKRGFVPSDMRIDQLTLKVQINSPLARAQKLAKVERVVSWLQTVISLGGQQAAFLVANIEKIAEWMADMIGVPRELLRTDEEKQQLQQDVAAIVAQQASASMPAQAS